MQTTIKTKARAAAAAAAAAGEAIGKENGATTRTNRQISTVEQHFF